jgi:Ca2+-binding RTX toxin-like protein
MATSTTTGTSGNDTITGGGVAAITSVTGAGNDYVDGGAGDDKISGGAGNDTLLGR